MTERNKMFCFQCQEANKNTGCTITGVCGKSPKLSSQMDIFKEVLKSLSKTYMKTLNNGEINVEIEIFIIDGLFKLITNANFDGKRFEAEIKRGLNLRSQLETDESSQVSLWNNLAVDDIIATSTKIGTLQIEDEDLRSLNEFVLTGLMGIAAYTSHANHLKMESRQVNEFIVTTLAKLADDIAFDEYLKLIDECGRIGLVAMELLDNANTTAYGNPEISNVDLGTGDRPGVLVSGHDLHDLEMLLEQSKDSDIDIYTHGEMLPAHYYPKLKKYDHLRGNYGSAWQNQLTEFSTFNGPILFTTNCIVPPRPNSNYADRVFTTSNTGHPSFEHITADSKGHKDFTKIIELAKKCEAPTSIEEGTIVGGFGHNQVANLASSVVENINNGSISKFVVMAGCDGRHKNRTYYTDFANALPNDTVILTAGCAKFKYNKLLLGDINGIPRVLDAGQCNDSYSLIKTALLLQDAYKLESVNDLPLVFNIAWYEQKAVIVLLTLLHLNVQNIKLGPSLPAFVSPNVANYLVENYGISTITTVEEDLKSFGIK